MTNTDDIINQTLGIINPVDKAIAESSVTRTKIVSTISNDDDIDNDYKYQRENLYNLINLLTYKKK